MRACPTVRRLAMKVSAKFFGRFRSLIACALVAAALFAQFANFVHVARVAHVSCEHGDLIEIESPSSAAFFTTVEHATVRESWRAEANHEHDHCLVSAVQRDRAATVGPESAAVTTVHSATAPMLSVSELPVRTIAVLLLAPKNSPPLS